LRHGNPAGIAARLPEKRISGQKQRIKFPAARTRILLLFHHILLLYSALGIRALPRTHGPIRPGKPGPPCLQRMPATELLISGVGIFYLEKRL
jgi:hypothetical protein